MVFSPKLVARYQELKEQVPDCLLLMQVGTFMQVMDGAGPALPVNVTPPLTQRHQWRAYRPMRTSSAPCS
jgi:hypothetical protein